MIIILSGLLMFLLISEMTSKVSGINLPDTWTVHSQLLLINYVTALLTKDDPYAYGIGTIVTLTLSV